MMIETDVADIGVTCTGVTYTYVTHENPIADYYIFFCAPCFLDEIGSSIKIIQSSTPIECLLGRALNIQTGEVSSFED